MSDQLKLTLSGPVGPSGPASSAIDYSNSVLVSLASTDLLRGEALVAAYITAKSLTPNGTALSSNNRAQVVLPIGKYKLVSSLILDTNFIDLVALVPTKPSRRSPVDYEDTPEVGGSNLATFRPQPTLVYTEVDRTSTIVQLANDVRLHGFSVAQMCVGTGMITQSTYYTDLDWGALLIGENCLNGESFYSDMYFWSSCVAFSSVGGVRAFSNFAGTWVNCISNAASFRLGFGDKVSVAATFSAVMYDCEAGPFSYVGDFLEGSKDNFKADNCRFERCKSLGYSWEAADGSNSFVGCNLVSCDITSSCLFIDCVSGDRSFGISNNNAGTFIRCRAGNSSFGGTSDSEYSGVFSGLAEDCVAGSGSFGGTQNIALGKCTGTLIRCSCEGNTKPMRLEGATIRSSRFTNNTASSHVFTLLDSNSSITNSDIIVLQGGTGVPIYAATSKNVVSVGNRMNNASNDSDGMHSNVTNLVSLAGNVVSNSIR